MKLTPLEEIYYDYTTTEEYAAHARTERVAVDESEMDLLLAKIASKALCNEISDGVTSVCGSYEANGFVLGFEYAMKILTQCGIGAPISSF